MQVTVASDDPHFCSHHFITLTTELSCRLTYWEFQFWPFIICSSVYSFFFDHQFSLFPLFLLSHFPPFCYHSNRRAALRRTGHTPRGPPLSSCSEGRMRRRTELREYVRIRPPPPPPLALSPLTLQPRPPPPRWSREAAWECRVPASARHLPFCCVTHGNSRFGGFLIMIDKCFTQRCLSRLNVVLRIWIFW